MESLQFEKLLSIGLNKEKLEKALKVFVNDESAEILNIISKNVNSVGDNYTSELIRIIIKFTTNKTSNAENLFVIIKCAGKDDLKELFVTEMNVFEKEIFVYNSTLPRLHKILGGVCLAPECILTELNPRSIIALKDLTPLGYKMVDRIEGLNLEQCFLVMKKIAQLHASSVILYEKDPQSMKKYNKGLLTNNFESSLIKKFILAGFQSLISATSKWPGFEKYGLKMEKMQNGVYEKCMNVCKWKPDQFNVLNHGDIWTNNILFLYDDNEKLIDLRFVDYQMSIYTTPIVDLNYFLFTSPNNDILKNKLNTLLNYYHENLVENLKNFGYPEEKIPSFQYIRNEFLNKQFYGVTVMVFVLPLIVSPKDRNDANIEEFSKGQNNEFRLACYLNPIFEEKVKILLPLFDELGLFD